MVLQVRHGALLAIAELLPALAASNEEDARLRPPEVAAVAAVVSAVEGGHYLRGKGSYIMREALCRCVCCPLPEMRDIKPECDIDDTVGQAASSTCEVSSRSIYELICVTVVWQYVRW